MILAFRASLWSKSNGVRAPRAPPLDPPLYFQNDFSPYANKSRTVLDFGFQGPDSLSVELEFRIPVVSDIPDSLSWISDCEAHDCGFQKEKLFQILESG